MRAGARLLPLVAALLVGCTPAAAQSGQRAYLPIMQLRALPTPTAPATPTATPRPGVACAADRLPVRALSDPDAGAVSAVPVARTIRELRETAPPPDLGRDAPRQPRVERSTFQLQVAVVELALRQSGALALSIADPDDPSLTGLVELPDPGCAEVAASARAAAIAAAREALLLGCGVSPGATPTRVYGGATITGVGFFDPSPSAAAPPNGLILSPVLAFASGDCNTVGPPSPTATPRRLGTSPPDPTPTATRPASPSPTAASATATRTPTPAGPLPPPTISFRGTGSQDSATYHLPAGRWLFAIDYTGSAALDAHVARGAVDWGAFAQCSTACSTGQVLTLPEADYTIQVRTASGDWTVSVRPG